jgi:hypothetical protein
VKTQRATPSPSDEARRIAAALRRRGYVAEKTYKRPSVTIFGVSQEEVNALRQEFQTEMIWAGIRQSHSIPLHEVQQLHAEWEQRERHLTQRIVQLEDALREAVRVCGCLAALAQESLSGD